MAAACRSGAAPEIALSIRASEKVEELLQALPESDGPLIGIHPGSGRAIKCWATEQFARLADLTIERLGARIVVFGGPGDEPMAQSILRHMRHGDEALSLAGRLTIQEFLVAASACDLFVGNDSGPAHLTGAAGVPTLAVYAGTIDAAQWAPLGPNAVTIYRGMMCAPCYFSEVHKCPYQVACLNRLPVEQVYEAAVRTLLPKWPVLRRRSPDPAARPWSPIADVLTQCFP